MAPFWENSGTKEGKHKLRLWKRRHHEWQQRQRRSEAVQSAPDNRSSAGNMGEHADWTAEGNIRPDATSGAT